MRTPSHRLARAPFAAAVIGLTASSTVAQTIVVQSAPVRITASSTERVCPPFCTADDIGTGTAQLPRLIASDGPVRSAEMKLYVTAGGTFYWNIFAQHPIGGYVVANPARMSATAPGVTSLQGDFRIPDCGTGIARFDFEGSCQLPIGGGETPLRTVSAAARTLYAGSGTLSIPISVRFTPQVFISGVPFMSWRQNLYADVTVEARYTYCAADFNADGFVDFFDYDSYVACFMEGSCPAGRSADFNADDFLDFFDYDAYVSAFEIGC